MKVENRKPEQQKEQRVDVRLDGVRKLFGDTVAVDHVDLEVYEGEFFSFLGPSGCGKTTCLRMVAGFEEPTAGRVLLRGRGVSRPPPLHRVRQTGLQLYGDCRSRLRV